MEVLELIVKRLSDYGVEAGLSQEVNESICFQNGRFSNADSGVKSKLEVRVTKGLRSGYAWTNDLTKWVECADRAVKLMAASSLLKIEPLISNSKSINQSFVDDSIIDADLITLKGKAKTVINAVVKEGVNPNELKITKSLVTDSFLNSNGVCCSQKHSGLSATIECSLGTSSAWDGATSQGLNIDFSKLGYDTALICKDSVKAKPLGTGLFDVALDFNAINELINILSPSLLANNVVEHNSILEGKTGQELINPLLTISDVGVLPDGINNSVIDGEGSLINDKALFNKGVLNSFMNDLYTAARMGVMPTGNSNGLLKRGFIGPNNWLVKPGKVSREELIDNCVYINALMGAHTANAVTGDFALSALNSFMIKDGVKSPLRDLMISGNIFDLLKKTIMVGRKPRIDNDLSTPLIKFEKVQLVG
ncbi:MAG: TldD/PmbA family protein [Candidatus Nanoarchaeia archaeon]